jgi:hypothetical protein
MVQDIVDPQILMMNAFPQSRENEEISCHNRLLSSEHALYLYAMNMPETEISRFYPLVLNINERHKETIGFKLSSRLSSFFAEKIFNTMIPLKLFLSRRSIMRH